MNSKNHISFYHMPAILFCSLFLIPIAAAKIIEDKEHTYLVDQTGERWDITQAVSIGFKPRYFEFGIGRNAFRPLSESDWSNSVGNNVPNFRIIGIADGDDAQAYSVSKLSYHEIANTMLASNPIAAGYGPLVDLAAVYSREIDEKVLTLAPSGWTYRRTFVLYDEETGTLWYPYEEGLMGIQGVYFQRWLPKISSTDTTWRDWEKKYPSSEIMKGNGAEHRGDNPRGIRSWQNPKCGYMLPG